MPVFPFFLTLPLVLPSLDFLTRRRRSLRLFLATSTAIYLGFAGTNGQRVANFAGFLVFVRDARRRQRDERCAAADGSSPCRHRDSDAGMSFASSLPGFRMSLCLVSPYVLRIYHSNVYYGVTTLKIYIRMGPHTLYLSEARLPWSSSCFSNRWIHQSKGVTSTEWKRVWGWGSLDVWLGERGNEDGGWVMWLMLRDSWDVRIAYWYGGDEYVLPSQILSGTPRGRLMIIH
ncbi:hypothetical protein BC629DRAFT_1437219 [Irpex lacteus]|nr:hypothetical protein BC629DRAFT_1437219 [Irpex lacteus]